MKLLFDKQVTHYKVDASMYTYGRLCSRIQHLLMGKENLCRSFNKPKCVVVVKNLYNVNFSGKNKTEKLIHRHHTGWPGGLREISIKRQIEKGLLEAAVRRSVGRMMSKSSYFKRIVNINLIFNNE